MPSPHPLPDRDLSDLKKQARRPLLAARRHLTGTGPFPSDLAATEKLLALPEVRSAGTVACYVAMGTEPSTTGLLDGLLAAGKRVLLPVLLSDDDLDWATYEGPDRLAPGRRGLSEPVAVPQGVTALATAEVLIVPALAIGPGGQRLGRGGGSYDRALARVPRTATVVALVHPGETGLHIPVEAHDRPVDVVVAGDLVERFGNS